MVAACAADNTAQDSTPCRLRLLARAGADPIFSTPDDDVIVFRGRLAVDADGSPRAYHPENRGLDDLSAARDAEGRLSRNVLAYRNERPYIQQPGDPAPGYYVSMTSLRREPGEEWDQTRYVNSEHVPYIVVPDGQARAMLNAGGMDVGDLAIVYNIPLSTWQPAIVAEYGPADNLGEGSMRLAADLGYDADPRTGGTEARQNLFMIFSGTRASPPWPRDIDELKTTAASIFTAWGGPHRLLACDLRSLNFDATYDLRTRR